MTARIREYQISNHINEEGAWDILLTISMLLNERAQLIRDEGGSSDRLPRARALAAMARKVEALAREAEKADI